MEKLKKLVERKKIRINIVLVCVLTITTLFLATKYDDYSQNQCISNGNSEYFCKQNL